MNSKEINTISYNFCVPESLRTSNFEITTFLNLKNNTSTYYNDPDSLKIEHFQKQASFIYEIKLNKVNDLLNCIDFFRTFKKRTTNLIRFDNWDDDKEFDFTTDYVTKFYFLIPNIYRLYNYYHINCNPLLLDNELKKIIMDNFLNV